MIFERLFRRDRVLAIAPWTHGIGFFVFQGPALPLDWGLRFARGDKNSRCLERTAALLAHYRPDLVVIEDAAGPGSRRAARVRELLDDIAGLARTRQTPVRRYARGHIRAHFARSGARTKHQIAEAIAETYPQLRRHLPPRRKIWLAEHYRMALFDAASLALTHYDRGARGRRAA